MKKLVALLLAVMMLCTGVAAVAENADAQKEPVTITFGGWGQYFLHTEWIEAFMAQYPWINVEIVHPVTGSLWNAEITQLAATGNMPDLFSCESLSYGVQNNWFYDLTDLFNADADSAAYPENLLPYGMKDGRIYMLASDMYPYYIEVNLSLLDEMNLPYPESDWSIDEWVDLALELSKNTGCFAVDSLWEFVQILPGNYGKEALSALSFNMEEKKWDFGEEMIDLYQKITDLVASNAGYFEWATLNYAEPGTNEEADAKRKEYLQENLGVSSALWENGKIGMRVVYSYGANWAQNSSIYTGFEYAAYPAPVAHKGDASRACLQTDFLCMSSACEHPEEAYLLLKYMTYSIEGYEARINAMKQYDRDAMIAKYPDIDAAAFPETIANYAIPPIKDGAKVSELLLSMGELADGLGDIVSTAVSNGFIHPQRTVVGWWESRGHIWWNYLNCLINGVHTPAQAVESIDGYANTELDTVVNNYGFQFGK